MIQFEGNARTDGRMDGQTLFQRTLPANAGGPKRVFNTFKAKRSF